MYFMTFKEEIMRLSVVGFAVFGLFVMCSNAQATTFTFDTAPFGTLDVRNIPGRQIVGGEQFISFSIGSDVFSLDPTVFGVSGPVNFVNASASVLPTTGVNVIVLDTFDNDANPLTPFGAGQAADLIADRVTTPGAGFFIYFNQSLDLPRLVYSTDLSDHNADLQILARMLNLNGAEGRNAMPTFTASNFEFTASAVPEASSLSEMIGGGLMIGCFYLVKRKRRLLRQPIES
jgi:hypothetical protein